MNNSEHGESVADGRFGQLCELFPEAIVEGSVDLSRLYQLILAEVETGQGSGAQPSAQSRAPSVGAPPSAVGETSGNHRETVHALRNSASIILSATRLLQHRLNSDSQAMQILSSLANAVDALTNNLNILTSPTMAQSVQERST